MTGPFATMPSRHSKFPLRPRFEVHMVLVGVAGLSLIAGAIAARNPSFILAGFALLGIVPLLTRPWFRLAFLLVGGVAVLQSSDGLNGRKLLYLAGVSVCFTLAAVRIPELLRRAELRPFARLPTISFCYGLYLLATLSTALGHGHDPTDWVRDVITYGLLAAAPIFAVDAGADLSTRAATRFLILGGLLGSIGFAIGWLGRRGVSQLPFGRLILPSFALCIVPFCYAVVRAAIGPRRPRWATFASLMLVLLLVTGTRTSLVLLLAFVAVVGSVAHGRAPFFRVASAATPIVALVGIGVPILAAVTVSDPTFLGNRLRGAVGFLGGGGSQDRSFLERSRAYQYTRDAWHQYFFFGTGPGHRYPSVGSADKTGLLQLDSPYMVLAKFGVIGTGALVAFLFATLYTVKKLRVAQGWSVVQTTTRATVVIFAATLPFGLVLEDKGAAFSLMLLLTLAVSWAANAAEIGDGSRVTGDGATTNACRGASPGQWREASP